MLDRSPELQAAISGLRDAHIRARAKADGTGGDQPWRAETMEHVRARRRNVSVSEIREHGQGVRGAALAIWLGILIDGIPESLVIGMFAINPSGVSLSFIAGVFLSNLPEAMATAVSMRNNGMRVSRIMVMWGSICVMTGIGAFVGASLLPAQPEGAVFYFVLGIEGLAAGAMLTMIAESMLPEAFEQGGSIIGLSTLAGFLVTLIVKVL
jgi:zinc transporter ZupT